MFGQGYWVDGCQHGAENYVGSFSIDTHRYDVHYYNNCRDGQSVCIRFGKEDSEYISPGSLGLMKQVLNSYPGYVVYATAYSMVLNFLEKKGLTI